MKTWLSGILCSALLAVSPDKKGLQLGDTASHTSDQLVSTTDNSYSFSDLKKAKGLLVIFSCNTCPFVVGSESFAGWEVQYNDLHQLAEQASVGMVLVNSNEAKRPGDDELDKMKIRASEKAYKMPYVIDKDHVIADAWGARTTPHVFLLDENMKLVFSGSIDNSWDSQRTSDEFYLKDALKSISNNSPISVTGSQPRGCSIKRKK